MPKKSLAAWNARVTEDVPDHGPGVSLLPLLRPYVRHCGVPRRPAWRLGPRKLLDYLMVYIEDGRGRFTIAGETLDAEPGDLFWIPPATVHEMEGYAPGMTCPFVHFDLVYRPGKSDWQFSIPGGMLDLSPYARLLHPPVPDSRLSSLRGRLRMPSNRRIGALLREITTTAFREMPYHDLVMSGLMTAALGELLRGLSMPACVAETHLEQLERAADFLKNHCAEQVALDAVALRAGYSPSHFRKLFRSMFGVPPQTYLLEARMSLARELLLSTSLSAARIGARCGYVLPHVFSRVFKRVVGTSPSAFRAGAANTGQPSAAISR